MAHIFGIGIATLDIINTTDGYPQEDDEVRAVHQSLRRGGNVTNTLYVLRQLGHECHWAGTLGDDSSSNIIKSELQQQQIDFSHCTVIAGGRAPTSYITLNQRNGSRTIVHFRDLAEYRFENFHAAFCADETHNMLNRASWLHVEGRNIPETQKILDFVTRRYSQLTISIEIEKPRDQIEALYTQGDVVFFSRHFATAMQHQNAPDFLRAWRSKCSAALLVCPWGAAGAYAIDQDNVLHHVNAVQIPQVVDTIGAGDTFNAGFIHASAAGLTLPERLHFANALAGKKCGQLGFDKLTENLPDDMRLEQTLQLTRRP